MRYLLCLLALASTPALAQTTQPAASGMDMGVMKLFNEADTNHDGAVTREEFLAKANQQFGMGDTNKDGKITRDEAQAHQQNMMNRFLGGNGNWQQKLQGFLGTGTTVNAAPGVTAPTAPTITTPSAPTVPVTSY